MIHYQILSTNLIEKNMTLKENLSLVLRLKELSYSCLILKPWLHELCFACDGDAIF